MSDYGLKRAALMGLDAEEQSVKEALVQALDASPQRIAFMQGQISGLRAAADLIRSATARED